MKKSSGRTSAYIFLAGAGAYFIVISIVSHIPGNTFQEVPFNIWDKAAHFIEYLPLGLLLATAIRRQPISFKRKSVLIWGALLVFGFGVLDEFHQMFVPGRFASWLDVVADTVGGFTGVLLGTMGQLGSSADLTGRGLKPL